MKIKTTLAAIIVASAMATSAFASDFCEVPKVLKEGKAYVIKMTTEQVNVKIEDIDDDACWVKVTDENFRIQMDQISPPFYLSVRQMVAIVPQQ